MQKKTFKTNNTVDGLEIRQSPVEVGSWNPIIYRVSAPSQVVSQISAINSIICVMYLLFQDQDRGVMCFI